MIKYFITMALVSLIPTWLVVYRFLSALFKQYYGNGITSIFMVSEGYTKNTSKKIFCLNVPNFLITLMIGIVISVFYIYFAENNILILPPSLAYKEYMYVLGILPISIGSFAGAITIRAAHEAWKTIQYPINEACFDHYIFHLQKIKFYLTVSVVCTYLLCGSMYVAVLAAPLTFKETFQPILVFLFFLVLWPLIMHVFCRTYLKLIQNRIIEEKYGDLQNCSLYKLESENDKRRAVLNLSSARTNPYIDYSLVFSLLISIAQIIGIFLEKWL